MWLNPSIVICFFISSRLGTRISKKKKLKINIHRPVGTRVVFDEEGKTLAPLARVAGSNNAEDDSSLLDKGNCFE